MPRMIVSIDGVVIKEVQLTKERTTLGRRPYNDIVIDNLAVSGEHAAIHMMPDGVEIEDLGSTNGTYVNAKAVKRQSCATATPSRWQIQDSLLARCRRPELRRPWCSSREWLRR